MHNPTHRHTSTGYAPAKRGLLAAACAILLGGGCATLGPEVLRAGRPAYNDAILATSDEQLLQNIIRLRFGDSIGFLSVSSVTANVSLSASGSVNAGVGPSGNFAGNLVPFAGTIATEQNPTLSYVPVGGDALLRMFSSEITLDRAILLLGGTHDPTLAWYMIVGRVNNLHNPAFPDPQVLAVDPRFDEIVGLATSLQRHGMLYWARSGEDGKGRMIVLHSYTPAKTREVARLLDLLGVAQPRRSGDDVVIPVQLSVGSPAPNTVSLETRSLFSLLRIAAASAEIGPDERGATRMQPAGPAAGGLRIRSADAAPAASRVAARYRDRWYFIDNEDEAGKQWFSLLQLLVGAQLSDSTAAAVPVLTIPVAGRR
ncbi:MAG: hypothetical protein FIB06_08135 [Betaproteobacteria bacterium]|nr:hypothetical protein [Betaproteobacteria bacterium]